MAEEHINTNFKMTELGPLPEDWEVVRFDKVVKTRGVKVGKIKQSEYKSKGKYPIIDQGQNLISGYWDNEEDVYKGELPVIIFGDHTRIFKFIDFPFVCGADGTKVLIPNLKYYDPRFLFYCFLTLKIPNQGYNRHFSLLKEKYIPLPPLFEQKAIARVLKAIQDAIEATEGVIAATRELKKSLIRHLFTYGPVPVSERDRVRLKQTEIGPIPEDWEVVKLGEVCNNMKQGRILPTSEILEYGTYPVYGANGVIGYYTECFVPKNKVLITCRGSTCGTVNFTISDAFVTNNAMIIYEDAEKVYWLWLYYCLQEFSTEVLKTGSGQPQITKGRLLEFKIPLPPLSVQQKIAQILKAVDEKIEAEEKKKEALRAFFKTMLHHLMTGKIRVKRL